MPPEIRDETACCVVLTTVASEEAANDLARQIVTAGLGACVQVESIRSHYRWQGAYCVEAEWRLHIKALQRNYPALEAFLRVHHPYELPEIVQLPIMAGSPDYLRWMELGAA